MAVSINYKGLNFRQAGELLKKAAADGEKQINLFNVNGQRYIAAGLKGNFFINIHGTPGNDLAAYMDGPEIFVMGNAQDGCCNTMNSGRVIINGSVGDIAGYAMRGGELFIKGNAGYRTGIHMKEYGDTVPVLVIGGRTGDFLGEYMAGGIIIVLGLGMEPCDEIVGNFCGTGMHGGVMYIRGKINPHKLGKEVKSVEMEEKDYILLEKYLKQFCAYFNESLHIIEESSFQKIVPFNKRPYGNLYTPH
ncbi:MAG TPA: hypothetical protein DEA47_05460 [Peptococcaceae bacterium]|nr:MAG: Glutamate synthase alpha subunit domain protein [Clostridia bacterium 41_269]HBT20791.1 hypothetical protein [Peptococcaceae bacterium]